MSIKIKKNLKRNLLIAQISIYIFIVFHSILWYVFGIHVLTKLCPFVLADQVGSLELNFAILFWILVFCSALFLGRAFCAWGCMFGAYQDYISRVAQKLKIEPTKNKYGIWLAKFLIAFIFIINITSNENYWPSLFWFIVIIILAGLIMWRFAEKGPAVRNIQFLPKYVLLAQYLGGIIALWISLNVFQKGFTFVYDKYDVFHGAHWISQITFVTMIAFTIAALEKRVFCKYLCPIGMILRLLSAIPFPKKYKVRATGEKCVKCGECNKECMMGLNPMEEINANGLVKNPNCINCLVCISECPQNAIDFKS